MKTRLLAIAFILMIAGRASADFLSLIDRTSWQGEGDLTSVSQDNKQENIERHVQEAAPSNSIKRVSTHDSHPAASRHSDTTKTPSAIPQKTH
jgi:hypothetical protein